MLVSFNPHTHEGCDYAFILIPILYYVSIHTPTKGVTKIGTVRRVLLGVSIHTPTKGVTRCTIFTDNVVTFQSTHPRRV